MDALRKEIDDEIKRTRLDKTRCMTYSRRLSTSVVVRGAGSVGPAGPPGPAGPRGSSGSTRSRCIRTSRS